MFDESPHTYHGDLDENGQPIHLPTQNVVFDVFLTPWKEVKRLKRAARLTSSSSASVDEGDHDRTPGDPPISPSDPRRTNMPPRVKAEPLGDVDLNSMSDSNVHSQTSVKTETIEPDHHAVHMLVDTFENRTDEQIKEEIQRLSNPSAKIKKDLEFNYEFVWDRLKYVGLEWFPINLDETIRYTTFSRYYISNLYGGGTVDTFPNIDPDKVAIHGIDNFAFPSLEYNPHAPKHPGAPGLFFRAIRAKGSIEDSRTFVRLDHGKWLYCGTYRITPSESLTPFEFQNQSLKVQRRWGKEIKAKKWGIDIVVRIFLRRRDHREPSEELVDAICKDKAEALAIWQKVTEEQIIDAYKAGEEELGVWCMKCVDYDVSWQRFLVDNYTDWERDYRARTAARQAKRSAKKQKRKKTTETREERIHRLAKLAGLDSDLSDLSEIEDSESDYNGRDIQDAIMVLDSEDEDMDAGDEGEEAEVLRLIAHGTRSRPRAVMQEPIVID